MPFSYATPTSGPSAGGIGWFNFGTLTMNPGDTITGLSGTLHDGTTVTFDLSLALTSGLPRTFVATVAPADPSSFFGRIGYTNISGNVSLYSNYNTAGSGVNTFTMSNIVLTDAGNNPVTNYTVVLADAETTNISEAWVYRTNGAPWQLLATVGNNPPTLTGIGTQTATIAGTQLFPQATQAAYLLTTQSPAQVSMESQENASGRQAISIGFAVTRVALNKYVGARIDAADQFQLNISGAPADQATTSGGAVGFQAQTAEVFATPGTPYGISESMAPGSISALTDYTRVVVASNATPAGSVPPTGSLPVTFTPALGDDVTYTIFNAIPQTFTKTVDKAYADIGDILTYAVTITNPNDIAVTNVLFTDPTPAGTTYLGNLLVSAPYSGTDPASGLTITSIAAKGSVTISWQVRIGTTPPIPNPVVNLADVVVPGGSSGMTNVVTTQIRTTYVSVRKSVDKANAQPGDVLTYTLTLSNAGNVVANSVVLTDALPAGTTFVPGSLTGATGTPPTLTLAAPLAAGGTATVTYQVKIGNAVPTPNPLPNKAGAVYRYTVDPAVPNGKTGTAQSNTVETLVSVAKLSLTKQADKLVSYLGDTVTYQISVTNTGNVPAHNVVLTDLLTAGTAYVPGSLTVSAAATGDPTTAIALTGPIAPGQTVAISFRVTVVTMPNPNPILNTATATYTYTYTVDPQHPDGVKAEGVSNTVRIPIFRNKLDTQISTIIESVSLAQAALAAIAGAEGAKIQKAAAMGGITADELLCINQSVADMMESISMLEAVLKQKLGAVDCQISGDTCK